MKKYLYYLLPLSSAMLASLSLFSEFTSFLVFIALIPLGWFIIKENKLRRLWIGVFLYHFVYVIVIGLFIAVEPLTWLLSSLIFSVLAVGIWLIKRYLPPVWFWLITPVLFVAMEFIRSGLSYIPLKILVLGNALGSTWFLPLAKLAGLWGLSLMVVAINLLFTWLLVKIRNQDKIIFNSVVMGLVVIVIVSVNFGIKVKIEKNVNNKTISIATVSFQTKEPALENASEAQLKSYTDELNNNIIKNLDAPTDYIFLPANILNTIRKNEVNAEAFKKFGIKNNGAVISFGQKLAKESGSDLVMGLVTIENENKKYNSILFFDKTGELKDVNHKIDLMIVSEYWPFGFWVPFWYYWMANIDRGEKIYFDPGFSRGEEPIRPVELGNLQIGALICSEAEEGSYFSKVVSNDAELVFTPINNNWFRGWSLKFYQTMVVNHIRINSIYYNVPVVLGGKNNYAGIILPDGTFNLSAEAKAENLTVWQGEVKIK
jgi:apolipoprotein N-acyltransferase